MAGYGPYMGHMARYGRLWPALGVIPLGPAMAGYGRH